MLSVAINLSSLVQGQAGKWNGQVSAAALLGGAGLGADAVEAFGHATFGDEAGFKAE